MIHKFNLSHNTVRIMFMLGAMVCVVPFVSPPIAMALGMIITAVAGNPFEKETKKISGWLLKASIVLMGFGMNAASAWSVGIENLMLTFCMIAFTLTLGWGLGKWLNIESKTAYLISCGTAICGGSAIAAVSPIVKAENHHISVSLAIVFILNTIALFIFPVIGQLIGLCEYEFGLWSALAIHDTSSVVGTSASYGEEALQVATLLKLQRALWIIPLSVFTFFIIKGEKGKISIPYFIFLFIAAMIIGSAFPQFSTLFNLAFLAGKKGLTITLFLIGAGLSVKTLKATGVKPFMQGLLLWIVVSTVSFALVAMCFNFI